jgi:hypothetical protein
MFDAEPPQIGFVLLQCPHGFIAFHNNIIANPGGRFHAFRIRRGLCRAETGRRTGHH